MAQLAHDSKNIIMIITRTITITTITTSMTIMTKPIMIMDKALQEILEKLGV